MEKRIIFILLLSIFTIVFYINFNTEAYEHVWNLLYYFQYYLLVWLSIVMIWILFKNSLIRILTVPIGVYYLFHFAINLIEIFNPELKNNLYCTTNINYCLSISMGLSIIVIPLVNKIKSTK